MLASKSARSKSTRIKILGMKLSLNHVQRLNLVALLDVTEASGRREAHAICKLQDVIDLEPGERETIELEQMEPAGGAGPKAYRWNPQKTLPLREYDFPPADIERICKCLDAAQIVQARDRWFRSLNAQLPEPPELEKEVSEKKEALNAAESKAHSA